LGVFLEPEFAPQKCITGSYIDKHHLNDVVHIPAQKNKMSSHSTKEQRPLLPSRNK
jgi:hypothetical protein